MLIVDSTSHDRGWSPINYMVNLASQLLEAGLELAPRDNRLSIQQRLYSILSQRKSNGREHEACLLICSSPSDLLTIFKIPGWRKRFRFIAAWVIDSFWLEWIPATIRLSLPFDHIFITSGEDIDGWYRCLGIRPTWLPWGTDVLTLGSAKAGRTWDLTRVGRQPPDWDDDKITADCAGQLSIRFHPRPEEFLEDPLRNHASLMKLYADSKYLLAFSNLVNPTAYTHPTREYVTGRWEDALGCGAVVAGVSPRGESIDSLLWPGATLDLGGTDRTHGLDLISEALKNWDSNVPRLNYANSLRRLDWRQRFRVIASVFGVMPSRLETELQALDAECLVYKESSDSSVSVDRSANGSPAASS